MTKYSHISLYIRKLFLISDFALATFQIFLYNSANVMNECIYNEEKLIKSGFVPPNLYKMRNSPNYFNSVPSLSAALDTQSPCISNKGVFTGSNE